ncbi:MAG: squalene synthase HpnC [Deltaproteobacteria bacterium]|nr:squalene synthase HpnC [Deltaproteobacteria bacterium]
MTYGHYENFPVASWLVPKRLRQHVCNIYAFARTADDFADEPLFAGERMERLATWRQWLLACAARAHGLPLPEMVAQRSPTESELRIFTALESTFRECQLPVQLCDDLLTAYMIDVKKSRYATFGEVMHYCRHSANPVGRLILHLFGYGNESWMRLSDQICTALQLANFWQDVAIDLQKDRIYLPQDEMRQYGVTDADLAAHRDSPAVRALIRFQVERTRQLFTAGRDLCTLAPHPRLRWELKLTWLGGMRILERIEQQGCNPFRRPQLRATDWARLAWRAWRW